MPTRKTKIVCTLGPSSDSVSEISKLISAGMDIARLNFSHSDHPDHLRIIKNLRKAAREHGKKIEIMQDLQGPKIRTGQLPPEGITIKRGQKIILTPTPTKVKSSFQIIPVQYKNIVKDTKANHPILIDDGRIILHSEKVSKNFIQARVLQGGIIKSRKGINLPNSEVSAQTITAKDLADLKFGLKQGIDYVALSFVRSAVDIHQLQKLIKKFIPKGKRPPKIMAKIERKIAIKNLEDIIKASDSVMVARGDLGCELKPEELPIAQKRIIKLANLHGKFVVTATQVLQSMIENPLPTRAEVSDAANAIFDHSDGILLSNETAIGKFPAKATAILRKVATATENAMRKHKELRYDI